MPDLTPITLPIIKQKSLPGMDKNPGFIYPAYDGLSILNLPPTICRLFGIPDIGEAGPLAPNIQDPLNRLLPSPGDAKHVILILMDSLSFSRYKKWSATGIAPVWDATLRDGVLTPLTSIVPSTTSAALTSLWTGRSATEHGIMGYEMWMKEYGVVANTILHSPITFANDAGSLAKAGFSPQNYLPYKTMGTHLGANGIQTFAMQHKSIVRSGLSQMFFRDTNVRAFNSAADLWVNLRNLLEENPGRRLYTWVYWSEVDHFGHLYGPDNERTQAEFVNFSQAFERIFLHRLGARARKDTLVILTADHGQIATPPGPGNELRRHPALRRCFHILPTGENRLAYFFVRPGCMHEVRQYMDEHWPGQFDVVESRLAIEAGLFGPGRQHPALEDRLGDYIVMARGDAYLWWADKDNPLLGRHGGLHSDEMLVPFLAFNLS